MRKEKEDERKPTFSVSFDGKEYSREEQEYLIFRFVQVLQRLDKQKKGGELLCR